MKINYNNTTFDDEDDFLNYLATNCCLEVCKRAFDYDMELVHGDFNELIKELGDVFTLYDFLYSSNSADEIYNDMRAAVLACPNTDPDEIYVIYDPSDESSQYLNYENAVATVRNNYDWPDYADVYHLASLVNAEII